MTFHYAPVSRYIPDVDNAPEILEAFLDIARENLRDFCEVSYVEGMVDFTITHTRDYIEVWVGDTDCPERDLREVLDNVDLHALGIRLEALRRLEE
jgi:hypothetical protein